MFVMQIITEENGERYLNERDVLNYLTLVENLAPTPESKTLISTVQKNIKEMVGKKRLT